jgi:hypothetical protein
LRGKVRRSKDTAMPFVARIKCKSCGVEHVLSLKDSESPQPKKRYDYLCPGSQQRMVLESPYRWVRISGAHPHGTIFVDEIK